MNTYDSLSGYVMAMLSDYEFIRNYPVWWYDKDLLCECREIIKQRASSTYK